MGTFADRKNSVILSVEKIWNFILSIIKCNALVCKWGTWDLEKGSIWANLAVSSGKRGWNTFRSLHHITLAQITK